MADPPAWGTSEPEKPVWGSPPDAQPLWGTPASAATEPRTAEPRPPTSPLPRRRVLRERLPRVPQRRRWRRAAEIAGLCAFLVLPVGGYLLDARDGPDGPAPLSIPVGAPAEGVVAAPLAPGRTTIFELTLGLCFDGTATDGLVEVSCDLPHQGQYVGSTTFAPGAYPGDAAVATAVDRRCAALFQSFTGTGYGTQQVLVLEHSLMWQALWESGWRDVRCAVHRADGAPLVDTTHA